MRPVEEEAFVEAVYLPFKLYGVGVPFGVRREARFVFCLVAPQNQQVGDA